MVPINAITQWRKQAPWLFQSQIEQDLVLSRALISLYQNTTIQETLAFRGGTALNKLFIKNPARYSEDLDFVQIKDEPIGELLSAIRNSLNPWLGQANWKQSERSVRLIYRFQSEDQPPVSLRLKIEINTIESFTLFGHEQKKYSMDNQWFSGEAAIRTYCLEELMGTKLRALYQRAKGRDLYDLWLGKVQLNMDCEKVLKAFHHYNRANNIIISRAEFEENLLLKLKMQEFLKDTTVVLSDSINWNPLLASELIMKELIEKLPGESWKLKDSNSIHSKTDRVKVT
jgi:predicted nucleotidyltransferase component of viral defense system